MDVRRVRHHYRRCSGSHVLGRRTKGRCLNPDFLHSSPLEGSPWFGIAKGIFTFRNASQVIVALWRRDFKSDPASDGQITAPASIQPSSGRSEFSAQRMDSQFSPHTPGFKRRVSKSLSALCGHRAKHSSLVSISVIQTIGRSRQSCRRNIDLAPTWLSIRLASRNVNI